MAPMKQTIDTTALLAQFDAACHKYAHKYMRLASVRAMYDHDDLYSIAQMAVLRAANEWDETKGTKLATHVINMIRWELGHAARKPVTEAQRQATYSIHDQDEEQGDKWHPIHEDTVEDDNLFDALTGNFDERDKRIAELRLVDELSFAEIGTELGISGERVRQLFDAMIPRIKARAASFIA